VQSKSPVQVSPLIAVPRHSPLMHSSLWHSAFVVHATPAAFSGGGATHFWSWQTSLEGQSVFVVHSGMEVQGTAEQVCAPVARAQQIPLAQSSAVEQASVGGVEQLLVHTEPLGFAQQTKEEQSGFVWHF
jgi:hypothetical protein